MNQEAYKQAAAVVNFVKSRYKKNRYTQSALRYKVEQGYSDCSSLVRAAYLKIGVNIGDWTGAQVLRGRKISIKTTSTTRDTSNMQMGDLIFFRNPNHVEIYMGGSRTLGHGFGIGPIYHNINTYRQGDFWQVRRYIDDIGTTETVLPTETEEETTEWKTAGTATCSGSAVNVRSTPEKTEGNILGQLGEGNRFEINGEKSGDWVKIRAKLDGKNRICWIYKKYVDYDQEESDVILAVTGASALHVRIWAGKEYDLINFYPVIPKGKQVVKLSEVKAKDGGTWYKIRISGEKGDKVGFANGKYLK